MANPRKFSEKIALQKQKQAEGTAEFERIMKEVYATKMDETQANQKILECCLGSGNNEVSNIGNGGSTSSGVGSGGASPEGSAGGGAGGCSSPTSYRESRGRSVGVGPMRRPSERKQDRSPYGSNATNVGAMGIGNNGQNIAYLSPPMDTSWRRSNSDSALHQSLNIAVAAEGNMGPGGLSGLPGDLGALHASYQHHNQRSHSPNIGRSYSPQAQRRKSNMMQLQQQQQQQQQQHHQQQLQMHQQHQMQQQHHHQLQQQQQQQQQHHQQQHQHHQQQQQQQQQQHFNAKFYNSNIPANSLFKSLQEQAMAIANTGSLPDLTSVHFATPTQQQMMHQQHQQQDTHPHSQQQQQQTSLSPVLSPHHSQNSRSDRDQSPSPFSPGSGGGGNGGGPPSPYHQPQHSPTSATTTPVSAAQTSPHMSFTNLAVQSPCSPQQPGQTGGSSYVGHLPTLGAANSTGNLTDYRQPLNPPSPGSSPGLLTSVSGTELHSSAPSSPIRLPQSQTPLQQHMQQQQQNYNEKNLQNAFDRYSESSYNSLNPAFHNHFEQFSLGDGNSSPDQQLQQHFQQQHNSFAALDFEDFGGGGGNGSGSDGNNGQHQNYSLAQNKLLNFNNLNAIRGGGRNAATSASSGNGDTNSAATCSNNNQQQQQHQSGRTLTNNQQQQRQLLNNNSSNSSTNATTTSCRDNNNANSLVQQQQNDIAAAVSPASQHSCLSSPSSPLPIPMPTHHHQAQQQHALSLSHTHSAQHSPHHSPLHSPHHTSPISASSPGISTLGSSISPVPNATTAAPTSNNQQQSQNQLQHQHQQQQQQQQQHRSNTTPTTANIPSIIFSDYSSNSDFSREIFDTLDLDLGQMDVAGLQMLSDPSTIMIADPSIEDNFRRDLN